MHRLYLITDTESARRGCGDLEHAVSAALEVGVRLVQYRDKQATAQVAQKRARRLAHLVRTGGGQLLVNDRVDIARTVGAHGVHAPSTGLSASDIRRQATEQCLVGASTHSLDEALRAQREGADFVTLSPIFLTDSKPGYGPALGLDTLAEVAEVLDIPVFALAGISPERVGLCVEAGAYGVAVMSGIMAAARPGEAAQEYLTALDASGI